MEAKVSSIQPFPKLSHDLSDPVPYKGNPAGSPVKNSNSLFTKPIISVGLTNEQYVDFGISKYHFLIQIFHTT